MTHHPKKWEQVGPGLLFHHFLMTVKFFIWSFLFGSILIVMETIAYSCTFFYEKLVIRKSTSTRQYIDSTWIYVKLLLFVRIPTILVNILAHAFYFF